MLPSVGYARGGCFCINTMSGEARNSFATHRAIFRNYGLYRRHRSLGVTSSFLRSSKSFRKDKAKKGEVSGSDQLDANKIKEWEDMARKMRPHDVKLNKTPEEIEQEKEFVANLARLNLKHERKIMERMQRFAKMGLDALNELPPELRKKALEEDSPEMPPFDEYPYHFKYTITPPDLTNFVPRSQQKEEFEES